MQAVFTIPNNIVASIVAPATLPYFRVYFIGLPTFQTDTPKFLDERSTKLLFVAQDALGLALIAWKWGITRWFIAD